jgi:Copper amine oxidase N-terminal domain
VKRLSTGALAALLAMLCGLNAVAAPSTATQGNIGDNVAQAGSTPPADFGSPPSGQIPILYNDHHVYSKPDVLKQGRVLAALVKGGTLLIPLRSMFEQMGATVSYDAGSKTATVSKPGAEVKVTVGKPEVVINGESRPLDVPPIIYQGAVLVPVRVISEGMGAYVQWVPDRHIVVVRYIPATPPPSPAPPPPTAAPPPPPPPPTPKPAPNVLFLAGDYLISPKIYNEFAPGNQANGSFTARGGVQFNAIGLPFMLEVDYKNWQYPHNCGVPPGTATINNAPQCYVTTIGSRGTSYVPSFTAVNRDFDARLGIKVLDPHVYVAVGYIWGSNNYGYPNMNAVGGGLEKLPDWGHAFTYYGSVYYYPNFKGSYTTVAASGSPSQTFGIGYNLLKYQVGIAWAFVPAVYLDAGWAGENGANKNNAPISYTFNGPYVGLGFLVPF